MKLPENFDYFGCSMTLFGVIGQFIFKMLYPYFVQAGDEYFSLVCVTIAVIAAYMFRCTQKK